MKDFKKGFSRGTKPGGFSGGGFSRPSFGGGPRGFTKRDSNGPTELFKATCSKCNNGCEVPFRPNGKKPVFCKDCFVRDERPAGNGFEKRSFGAERPFAKREEPSGDPRIGYVLKELQTISAKLDTILQGL